MPSVVLDHLAALRREAKEAERKQRDEAARRRATEETERRRREAEAAAAQEVRAERARVHASSMELKHATAPEVLFAVVGWFILIVGVLAAAVWCVIAINTESYKLVGFGGGSLVGGLLASAPYFAVSLMLRYLRRNTRAVEAQLLHLGGV